MKGCRGLIRQGYVGTGLLLAFVPYVTLAQDSEPPASTGDGAPTANVEDGVAVGRGRVFTPDYFTQYAPRNALDMVEQIPGFAISGGSGGQRGLGQADENVLVNGERFSSKSESVRDQLRRIPAGDVVRIEIVDGTTLDIPGLTGEVANIVVKTGGTSGQFRWNLGFRPYNTSAQLFGGEASLSGSSGQLSYTVALSNENNRFGADGFNRVTGPDGGLIELQETQFSGGFDNPRLATNWTYRFTSGAVANLNLSYREDFFFRNDPEIGRPLAGPVRVRFGREREDGPEYEIGGDVEVAAGPGRLKLIGLERFERDNFESEVVDSFDDGRLPLGSRFEQVNEAGERIGRAEYGWRMWSADWQLAGEAAFNRLNRASALFVLNESGAFVPVPFPRGTGGVTEDRYEGSLSYSRQLARTLAFQAVAAGEYSRLEQTGALANTRTFVRPKGSVSLAWTPANTFNASLELERRVGQLSFGDFLANVALNDENESAGNRELVPFQAWDITLEVNKTLGPWGSAKLEVQQGWFEDFIDFLPLDSGGEARGNIGAAERFEVELNATILFDPLGWRGAQLQVEAERRWSSLTDPFTGLDRPWRGEIDELDLTFRHDVPRTSWAYGGNLFTFNPAPYSRLFEVGRGWEGPVFLSAFVENKDVLGLTINAQVSNIAGARDNFQRTVFAGPRPFSPVLFAERFDRRIGPIFRLSISGSF